MPDRRYRPKTWRASVPRHIRESSYVDVWWDSQTPETLRNEALRFARLVARAVRDRVFGKPIRKRKRGQHRPIRLPGDVETIAWIFDELAKPRGAPLRRLIDQAAAESGRAFDAERLRLHRRLPLDRIKLVRDCVHDLGCGFVGYPDAFLSDIWRLTAKEIRRFRSVHPR